MPPVIIAGAIAAGASAYAAHKQSQAQKKATEAQSSATDQALAFQREQEATRKANFDRAYNIWNASRNALLERYGIDIADVPGAAPGAPPAGAVPAAGAMPPAAAMARPAPAAMPSTIGDMIAAKGPVDPWATRNPFTA